MGQGKRAIWHDYRGVGFYMLTLTTAGRRPLFGQVVAPGVMELSSVGYFVLKAWRAMPSFTPQLETTTFCVMPDHLHGIIAVRERLARPLGAIIRGFKSGVTTGLRKVLKDPCLAVWEEGFYDGVALESATIQTWHRYILDNPRRLWLKRQHPDLFVRINTLEHERLPALSDGQRWSGYGNLFLLDKPERVAVRVSRSATQEQIRCIAGEIAAQVRRGAVAVSPFISPGEQAVVTALAQTAPDAPIMARSSDKGYVSGGLIVLKHGGFPPLYKPSGRYFDLCASGRLLVLSPFQYTRRKDPLTREQCLRMNGWCEAMCE